MKFLCDRCKTRYSIGDERVRGKILKIRCKNCANVITVREGMSDVDAADPAGKRGTTQAVPLVTSGTQPGAVVPSAAGAAKPPPALEEEWYVSKDGEQEGPFSLGDAQRWVAGKPHDADLHCWSEGFDDWLPVDKVSHFRGLRKPPRAATAAPPPLPRAATAAGPAASTAAPRPATAAGAGVTATPRPATAAGAARPATSGGVPKVAAPAKGVPKDAAPAGGASKVATPAAGLPKLGGAAPPAAAALPDDEPEPAPLFAATMAALEKSAPAPLPAPAVPGGTPATGERAHPGTNGAHAAPAAGAFASRFDLDDGDASTQIGVPPFPAGGEPAEPAPAPRADTADIFAAAAAAGAPAAPGRAPMPTEIEGDDDEDDGGGLAIGEVSRVVKLADLQRPRARTASVDPTRRTGAVASLRDRGSGPVVAPGRTGAVPRLPTAAGLPDGGAGAADPMAALAAAPAPPDSSHDSSHDAAHRRHMIILIGVAAVLLAAGALAVVMLVGRDDGTSTYLGRGETIDTTRPDQPLRRITVPGAGSATEPVPNPLTPRPPVTRPRNPTVNAGPGSGATPALPEVPGATRPLGSEEIEEMAARFSGSTQRCYMRSQKGADAVLIGDVKKIAVTLSVGPDGAVNDVQLSDNHATNNLGRCLIGTIKGWRFRASPGGTFRFSLQFVSG